MEKKLKNYLKEKKIVNGSDILDITPLTDGKSSNHLNYKVTTTDNTYIARITKPGDMLSYSNLADEYTILKKLEDYNVGPKVYSVDLEYFNTPILLEEFIDGVSFDNLKDATDKMFNSSIDLIVNTSKIKLSSDEFPFKFTYSTYETNFKAWDIRFEEIIKSLGENHNTVSEFKPIIESARKILEQKDILLRSAPKEFIYNDVHPGNTFWLSQENKAIFIDWQKVSLGDPSFMIALFARHFGHIWSTNQDEFIKKSIESYKSKKQIENLEKLFYARILERTVSDMIWIVWEKVKKGLSKEIGKIEENKYYLEAKKIIEKLDISSHSNQ